MNVLLFNLRTDTSDTALGFTTGWINELARHCDRITVVTMYAGEVRVASNVEVLSLGKEQGFSEPRRLLRFYRLMLDIVRKQKIDVAFAHMAPLFAALFAPIAKAKGIPLLLWYAHRSVPLTLRVAHRLVDECVSPTPESFRLKSSKVSFVGHGVDTAIFTPPPTTSNSYELTAVTVGRLTRIKNLHEIVEAVAHVRGRGFDLRLNIIGGPLTRNDIGYAHELRTLTERLGLSDAVTFNGPIPFAAIAEHYRCGGIFINLCESALDKAIIESMASGCIPICRNGAFGALAAAHGFPQLISGRGAEAVADRISIMLEMQVSEKQELRRRLRQVVAEHYSLDALAQTLAARLRRLSDVAGR
jgi:glycosyltransferase involved in cell wall biosynthesis